MDAEKQLLELGVKLAELTVKNTAGAIASKVQSVKAKKNDQETINELEEIINSLISDKNELVQIAQSYEQEFVAQKISKEDIDYITNSFIPILKEFIDQLPKEDDEGTKNMQNMIDILKPLLSVESLTILQLLGFNFKQAIGEPLTLLLRSMITSRLPVDPEKNQELNKLLVQQQIETLKIVQSKEASERLEKLK